MNSTLMMIACILAKHTRRESREIRWEIRFGAACIIQSSRSIHLPTPTICIVHMPALIIALCVERPKSSFATSLCKDKIVYRICRITCPSSYPSYQECKNAISLLVPPFDQTTSTSSNTLQCRLKILFSVQSVDDTPCVKAKAVSTQCKTDCGDYCDRMM